MPRVTIVVAAHDNLPVQIPVSPVSPCLRVSASVSPCLPFSVSLLRRVRYSSFILHRFTWAGDVTDSIEVLQTSCEGLTPSQSTKFAA
jgi:hypothetical protein